MKSATPSRSARLLFAALAAPVALAPFALAQTDGQWTNNNSANWSATGSWLGGNIADGAGSTADFSQLNITGTRTITIDTTPRTLGTLLLGDIDSTHGYNFAGSGGGTLTFNNNGSAAALTQGTNSGANAFNSTLAILLADSLNVSNNHSTSTLTFSGNVSASTAGTKTITNQGSGAGGVTFATGVIGNGSGTVALVQNSGTSQLTLSGTNTFTGGVTIQSGTIVANNAAALGSGTLLLGATSGSAPATLLVNSFTIANPITVQATGTGTRAIASNGNAAARPSGDILLNNHLTLEVAGGGTSGRSTGAFLSTSGTISGTGNLNLNVTGALSTANDGGASQLDSINVTGAITSTGTINNVGTGTGRALISGNISAATALNQNSATSQLSLTGTNTYSGPTNVNFGVLRSTSVGGLSPNSAVTVASGAALQIQNTQTTTQTLTLSGQGNAYSDGALSSINVAAYAGPIALAAGSTISSTLAATTLTLSGGITGSGHTLTTSGVGNIAISGAIGTGTGGLVKEGSGTLTLSGSNSYSGNTTINNGAVLLSSAGALDGGGTITLNGGSLRHSATNTADYASRIVNSTGPVAIDTNNSNVTYAGNLASSNTGGLTKLGTATLTLSGTNAYTGVTAINNGGLAITTSGAIPSGNIFIDAGGILNGSGAHATAQDWLNSGKISTASTGGLALVGNSDVNLAGYNNLMLVTTTTGNTTYTGTITPAGGFYRLGGSTSNTNLTLSNANALTGANGLVVGARNGASASGGTVILSNSNDLTGATTVNTGTLSLTAAGTIAGSAVTVNNGTTFAITSATSGTPVTRAAALTLNRGILTVAGNATANSTETITGALTVGSGGHSTITLTPNAARNTRLDAGSYAREAGGTAIIRGTSLGTNAFGTINSANASFTTPNLVGNGGTGTDRSIFVGLLGDTSTSGNGFGATGGLLTQDATNGVRRLAGADYKTSITDGQTTLDNVQLASTGTTNTVTLALDTTLNSLSLNSTTAAGANVQVGGAGKLTLNSGVLYANSVTATTASAVSNTIHFNNREGIILAGGSADLTLSGVLEGTDGKGLTVYAPSRTVTLSGSAANTYTGTTTVNGGTLALNKTAGTDAIAGNLVVNTGATVSYSASNQIADTANLTLNGGNVTIRNETVNNFSVLNGSAVNIPSNTNGVAVTVNGALAISGTGSVMRNSVAGTITVAGATNLSDGGVLTLNRSQNVLGNYDSVATLGGGLNITHTTSGAYTPLVIGHGSGLGQSGAKVILGGDVTFTGNSTNTNTVLIDAIKGSGRQGVIELTSAAGNRTFNIGNGAAATDLRITAALLDGAGGASGLVKTGLGTLELSGVSTYTGSTTVSGGSLLLSGSVSGSAFTVQTGATLALANGIASGVTINSGAFLTGSGTVGNTTVNGTLAIGNSPGTLTLSDGAALTLGSGSVSNFEFTSSGFGLGSYDRVLGTAGGASETAVLGGTLNLAFSGIGYTAGTDVARIFDLSSISGSFTSINVTGLEAFELTATFNSSTGYISLAAIPEPSAFAALAGLGVLALAATRRRSRR